MAQIEGPVLPRHLYRYRSLTRDRHALRQEMAAIRDRYIWCAVFDRMNDPMEGFYEPSSGIKQTHYAQIARNIAKAKTNVGIASFSDTKENVLMWTHYADNYSGICLAYSTERLVQGLPEQVSLVRLAYGDDPPRIEKEDVADKDLAARRILSQKKFNWAYEREWRVLGPIGKAKVVGAQAITHLYFGARVNRSHKAQVLAAIKGTRVKAYTMDVDGYDHEWKPANNAARAEKNRAK